MIERKEMIGFANYLADESAKITMSFFCKDLKIDNKSKEGFDPVTQADKEAEKVIRSILKKEFPNHGILGEELEKYGSDKGFHWVIDPIDGTRAYISQIPLWGTLIALNDGKEPIFGLVDQPFLEKRFFGFNDESFMIRNKKKVFLRTSNTINLEESVMTCTDPFLFNSDEKRLFEKLISKVKMRRFGLDCTGFCLLASGQLDIVIEARLKPYDVQALIPIIKGSGGKITTWEGGDPSNGGNILATCNDKLHDKVSNLLL